MTLYRFDQIAECLTVRFDPGDTTLEGYVGLEHLDPESLKLGFTLLPSTTLVLAVF
jgi:hypothetical protein